MSKEKLSEKIWEQSSEWVNQIGVVIGDLAKQMGVATEHVYTVYTKQIFFEGIVWASFSLLFILIALSLLVYVWFTTRNIQDVFDKTFSRVIATVVGLIIIGLLGFYGLVPNLLKVFNPEYYTIKTIIDQIGTMVK